MPAATVTRRILKSQFLDLLVGPHGIDRYLELIRPEMTVHDARAEVIAVRRQTARSVTLTLRPNRAWEGFQAGQFVRLGVEIDGVRRTRTYSPACSQYDGLLELTVTVHPGGLVSTHLQQLATPGSVVHLGAAAGSFVLPDPRPERLVLISGGSGITPVLSMLRTLRDEGYGRPTAFLHYARTEADWLYRAAVEKLIDRHAFIATRQGGAHLSREAVEALIGDLDGTHVAVCGPPSLIEATKAICPDPELVLSETFTPPSLKLAGESATGTVSFLRSGASASITGGSLLEQAEAAGLTPEFGCRMGICHTCTCRKAAGAVRNLLTGEISDEEDEDIQLCISVPAGDVALEI